jgi:predicted GTPase
VTALEEISKTFNPDATVVRTSMRITADDKERMRGAMVLAVEDGPTVTHGGMPYGAAALAARSEGAAGLVDARPYAAGSLADTYAAYPHMERVLPAMGYSSEQLADLEATIKATPADVVAIGTPIDLARLIDIDRPIVRVRYRVEDAGEPTLDSIVDEFLRSRGLIGD